MANDGCFLQKVSVNSSRDAYHMAITNLHERGFDLTLTNCNQSYSGKCDDTTILALSERVEMDADEYWMLLKQAFGCSPSRSTASKSFSYQLDPITHDKWKLSWKQVLEDGVKFHLGSLELNKEVDNGTCVSGLMTAMMDDMNKMRDDLSYMRRENQAMEIEHKTLLKRLEGYVHDKNNLEADLYAKFSLILNEKKAKIRSLKEQGVHGRRTAQPQPPQEQKKEEDSGETTEEDTDKEDNAPVHRVADASPPASSSGGGSAKAGLFLDDSLEEEEDDGPSRRRRHKLQSRPRTPVTTVLPRTTSFPRPVRSEVKMDVHRSDSALKKRKSTDEAEDLMDEL